MRQALLFWSWGNRAHTSGSAVSRPLPLLSSLKPQLTP
jgi:hypothetical protein